jgi:hypothetical protein
MLNPLSIQKIIQYKLAEFLTLKKISNNLININNIVVEILSKKYDDKFIYKSPFCLQIAKFDQQNSQDIAQEFVNLWVNFLDLQVSISSNNWLEFTIGDRFLEIWLQQLPTIKLPNFNQYFSENNLDFKLYYTHARCCSLLISAHRDNLIQLKSIDFNQRIWLWDKPDLIPYNCCLNFKHEKNLIRQLMIIVDAIYDDKKSNWLKLASDFSDVILYFERNCRIWGEVKAQNLALSHARLGLIALAQFYFQWILEQQLSAIAPFNL